jgi:hypothetical protein
MIIYPHCLKYIHFWTYKHLHSAWVAASTVVEQVTAHIYLRVLKFFSIWLFSSLWYLINCVSHIVKILLQGLLYS